MHKSIEVSKSELKFLFINYILKCCTLPVERKFSLRRKIIFLNERENQNLLQINLAMPRLDN